MQCKCAMTGDKGELASFFVRTFVKKKCGFIFYKYCKGKRKYLLILLLTPALSTGKMGYWSLCPLKQNCTFKVEEVENSVKNTKKPMK